LAVPPFRERLQGSARTNRSWLCVGLDVDPDLVPRSVRTDDIAEWVPRFLLGVVEATRDLVCCFKPNIAFFEALGLPGQQALRSVLAQMPRDIPVLIDAKRGDMANTMRAYARAMFEDLGADAVTVNPYQGGDALEPFLRYPGKGVFVLCKTSNPGSGEIQDLPVPPHGEPLFLHVARRALSWERQADLGLVVGATFPRDIAAVRAVAADVPLLIPGVGAQSGDLEAAVAAAGQPALINASRSVLYASRGSDWQTAARAEAERLRAAIQAAHAQLATPAG
jgi:orotidine-5'-phosphate decarboxylase